MVLLKEDGILIIVFLINFILISVDGSQDKEQLALIRELHDVTDKRTSDLLPDHMPIDISTKEGNFHFILVRNKALDVNNVQFLLHQDGKEEVLKSTDEQPHGYYQDAENGAVIHARVVKSGDTNTRQYSGTLRLGGKLYELNPVKEAEKLKKELQEERNEDLSDLHIHSVTHTDINKYKKSEITYTTKKPDRGDPEEYATFLRQVKELASAQSDTHTRQNSRKRGQGSSSGENNGNGEGNNGNSQGNGAVVDVETGKKTRPAVGNPTDDKREVSTRNSKISNLLDLLKLGKDSKKAKRRRRKRNASSTGMSNTDYKIEVVCVVGHDLYEQFVNIYGAEASFELKRFILHTFNGLHMALNRMDTPDFAVRVILRQVVIKTSESVDLLSGAKTDGYVCPDKVGSNIYKTMRVKKMEYTWTQTDHIAYFTTKQLAVCSDDSCSTYTKAIGNAPFQSGCDPYYGFSAVMIQGQFSWLSFAHEFAHSWGADHDGFKGASDCKNEDQYIMSKQEIGVDSVNVDRAFSFSHCSIRQMRGFMSGNIDGIGKTCIFDDPCTGSPENVGTLTKAAGQVFTLNEQCQIRFKNPLATYTAACNTNNDICQHLSCNVPGVGCTSTDAEMHSEIKAYMGTKCDKYKWCMLGKCVSKDISVYSAQTNHCSRRKKRSLSNSVPAECSRTENTKDEVCTLSDNTNGDMAQNCPAASGTDPYFCHKVAIDRPDCFFTQDNVFKACRKNAYKFGLYFDINEPCLSDSNKFSVSCLVEYSTSVSNYGYMCDGYVDCLYEEDEDIDYCQYMARYVPFCFDDWSVHCPTNFDRCIPANWGCDDWDDCGDGGSDEDEGWCKELPMAICPPGQTNSNRNPARCVPT